MSFRSIIGKTFRHPISKLIFHSGKKAQLTMYPVYSSRFMSRPRPTEFIQPDTTITHNIQYKYHIMEKKSFSSNIFDHNYDDSEVAILEFDFPELQNPDYNIKLVALYGVNPHNHKRALIFSRFPFALITTTSYCFEEVDENDIDFKDPM